MFERKEHAGWDPLTQTFILKEVPTQIKQMLKRAGFKKKDLRKQKTALAIFEVLLKEMDQENNGKYGAKGGGINSSNPDESVNTEERSLVGKLGGMFKKSIASK